MKKTYPKTRAKAMPITQEDIDFVRSFYRTHLNNEIQALRPEWCLGRVAAIKRKNGFVLSKSEQKNIVEKKRTRGCYENRWSEEQKQEIHLKRNQKLMETWGKEHRRYELGLPLKTNLIKGRKFPFQKLTLEQVQYIYDVEGIAPKDLAKKFGINVNQVYRIRLGQCYKGLIKLNPFLKRGKFTNENKTATLNVLKL